MHNNNYPMIWMFSGQGTQYYKMGRILFDSNKIFHQTIIEGDQLFKQIYQISLINYMYSNTSINIDNFFNPGLSDPCIILVEVALARLLFSEGFRPQFIIATNIGEITSAIITNTLSFPAGLILAYEQSNIVNTNKNNINLFKKISNHPTNELKTILSHKESLNTINKRQLLTTIQELLDIYKFLECKKINCQITPITNDQIIEQIFKNKKENNTNTKKAINIDKIINTTKHSDIIWENIKTPLSFTKTIKFFESLTHWTYIDCSPTETLSKYVNYCLKKSSKSKIFPIMSPYGNIISNIEKIKQENKKKYM